MKCFVTGVGCALWMASCSVSYGAQLLRYDFELVEGADPFTTPDSSGRGNDGTLINMDAANLVPGRFGNALQFDGGSGDSADRVELPSDHADFNRSYAEFTLAAWLKPVDATPSTDAWIAGKLGSSGNRGWHSAITGGNHPTNPNELFIGYFDAPSGVEHEVFSGPVAALADDAWIHWAVTFKANESVKLYINASSEEKNTFRDRSDGVALSPLVKSLPVD